MPPVSSSYLSLDCSRNPVEGDLSESLPLDPSALRLVPCKDRSTELLMLARELSAGTGSGKANVTATVAVLCRLQAECIEVAWLQ